MIPTLQTFSRALLAPDLSLATLAGARAETDANALPHLMRTTRFAEATIQWQGRRWLLSMPLNQAAMFRTEQVAPSLRRLTSKWLLDYRILPGELRWHDAEGREQSCDLILQHLPEGSSLTDALLTEEKSTLLTALDSLEAELIRLNLSHNNLKAENLRWSGGKLIPLRYHDVQTGLRSDADAAAFEALRRMISGAAEPAVVTDAEAPYDPVRQLTGHLWTSHVFEGLVCVEDESGFGYVDTSNRPVIESQFIWANDFHEGRAEVETATGMGLIDREGNYIIPPQYEIVDYNPAESVVLVRQDQQWALFDYLGRRLTEFRRRQQTPGSEIC